MFHRTLPRDAVLWWTGDVAASVGVVERGLVAIRTENRLLDVSFPGTVLGESALLTLGGTPGKRTADVVVLEDDTVVSEYPVEALADEERADVRALLLRTLLGQTLRNHLLVAAAHPAHPFLDPAIAHLLESLAWFDDALRLPQPWSSFRETFRLLYRMREGSDGLRHDLAPPGTWSGEAALKVLDRLSERLQRRELVPFLAQFVRVEADRLASRAAD